MPSFDKKRIHALAVIWIGLIDWFSLPLLDVLADLAELWPLENTAIKCTVSVYGMMLCRRSGATTRSNAGEMKNQPQSLNVVWIVIIFVQKVHVIYIESDQQIGAIAGRNGFGKAAGGNGGRVKWPERLGPKTKGMECKVWGLRTKD